MKAIIRLRHQGITYACDYKEIMNYSEVNDELIKSCSQFDSLSPLFKRHFDRGLWTAELKDVGGDFERVEVFIWRSKKSMNDFLLKSSGWIMRSGTSFTFLNN